MQKITYIQGNTLDIALPIVGKVVTREGDVTTITTSPYQWEDGDVISVKLIGERRTYTYAPAIDGSNAIFVLEGTELAGKYGIEVIIYRNGKRLRYANPLALELLPFTGDYDTFVDGMVTLDASIFILAKGDKGDKGDTGENGQDGEDGRGIVSIAKTASRGNTDTYTITYTDGTTSTFQVTNGINGQDGAQGATGATGVGIASVIETTRSTASEGVNVVTVTLTNGVTSTFEVRNGAQGEKGDAGAIEVVEVGDTAVYQPLSPNTFYNFTEPLTSLEVSLVAGESGIANVYAFRFTAGIDNPTITLPSGVECADELSLSQGDVCEMNILDNKCLFSVWKA